MPWEKTLKRYGVQTEGLIVHQDQDGVYLGHGWLYELAVREHVRRHSALGNKSSVRYLKEKGKIAGGDVSAN